MYIEVSYFIYLALSVAVTVWVARTLHRRGRIFLVDAFGGNTELADAVNESFGSVANLKGQLNEAALNVQGSGWGTLAWEPLAKRLVTEQVYDHQGNIGNGTVPLLVLDMWEHAYYLQYQNVKGDWVKAFWKIVNWEDVRQRLQKVRNLDLGL